MKICKSHKTTIHQYGVPRTQLLTKYLTLDRQWYNFNCNNNKQGWGYLQCPLNTLSFYKLITEISKMKPHPYNLLSQSNSLNFTLHKEDM